VLQIGGNAAKAVQFYRKAGDLAGSQFSIDEAVHFFSTAINIAQTPQYSLSLSLSLSL
jgi:hypothetical protein